jgi:hypothetical protein
VRSAAIPPRADASPPLILTDNNYMNQKIILLFGMPRSGTTWIGKIFDSHPDTLYRHEPDSWGLLNSIPLLPAMRDRSDYAGTVMSFAAQLRHMNATKISASLPIFGKRYYTPWRMRLRSMSVSAAKVGAKIFGEFPVPQLIPDAALDTVPLVWKSIESLGRLGVIVASLENARAIQILRHPGGYVASVLRGESRHKFTGSTPSSEDYGVMEMMLATEQARRRSLTLAYMKALLPVERLAWRWALFNEKAMDDTAGNENTLLIKYEDICRAPMAKAKAMFEFCGLGWNPQTEAFIADSTGEERAGYYSVMKDPVKAANKWRRDLAEDDVGRIMSIVAETAPGRLYLDEVSTGSGVAC